jgi:hypothetical protein
VENHFNHAKFSPPVLAGENLIFYAGIAQLVEQLICNQQVVGSSPSAGSTLRASLKLKA